MRPGPDISGFIRVLGLLLILPLAMTGYVTVAHGQDNLRRPATPRLSPDAVNATLQAYRLGPGDKLRVLVFGEDDLTGDYEVDGQGVVSIKLVGRVSAADQTVPALEDAIREKLLDGYLRNPRVSIDVLNYRPFYILGEVEKRGSYPYVNGMTVANAIAIAGGYTYRASRTRMTIQRFNNPDKKEETIGEEALVLPGDIIRVAERFF